MYELIIKKLLNKYKIYTQIDDFLEWKSRFACVYYRKEKLYDLVKQTKRTNIKDITVEDLEEFKRHLYTLYKTNTELISSMREVRCFLRYHHKRGVQCLKPEVVGDLDINYSYR